MPRNRAMPTNRWNAKRERQYRHIEQSELDRGVPEDEAREIAARTVNKERARAGEAEEASRTSVDDISSGRRGGLRSHSGARGRTYDQLYAEARRRNIAGRSKMNKAELERALSR
jgi:hypothetical protein